MFLPHVQPSAQHSFSFSLATLATLSNAHVRLVGLQTQRSLSKDVPQQHLELSIQIHCTWVEVRDGPVGTEVSRTLNRFHAMHALALRSADLWISNSTFITADIASLVEVGFLTLHYLPVGMNGYIGKAYALLHSPWPYTILFDGDSQVCPGWIEATIHPWLLSGADIMWTLAPSLQSAGPRRRLLTSW